MLRVGTALAFNFNAKASKTAFCDGATSVVPLLIASATAADFARPSVKYKLVCSGRSAVLT